MHLIHYLEFLRRTEADLAVALRATADAHGDEPDVASQCETQARRCEAAARRMAVSVQRYRDNAPPEPDQLHSGLFGGTRSGGLGLIRDLHDLYLMAAEAEVLAALVAQAAQGLRDEDLLRVVNEAENAAKSQQAWLRTRMKQAAPQALVVAE
jgi:hypothetical protein